LTVTADDALIPYRNLGLAVGTLIGVTAGAAAGQTETGMAIGAGLGVVADVWRYFAARKQATGPGDRSFRTGRAEPGERSCGKLARKEYR
jgi:hypothetical protein